MWQTAVLYVPKRSSPFKGTAGREDSHFSSLIKHEVLQTSPRPIVQDPAASLASRPSPSQGLA